MGNAAPNAESGPSAEAAGAPSRSSAGCAEGVHDAVAVFHASFHPTKGNVIDWSVKTDDGLSLDGVEFCVLPSGLHLVEQDTVYFSHGPHSGIAVFRRLPTSARGYRGFRLASLGILLRTAPHPRPWLHVQHLRELADAVYATADLRVHSKPSVSEGDLLNLGGSGDPSASTVNSRVSTSTTMVDADADLTDADFAPVREWFERVRADNAAGTEEAQTWAGWSDELDGIYTSPYTPALHLAHLLRIFGTPSLTLYKCVLARRRILIYTLPPVEAAGVLAWVAADLCHEHHMVPSRISVSGGKTRADSLRRASPTVLGMITLSDIPRLEQESARGTGWIACTTDALFLERPQYYDLVIDLTTATPGRAARPALYLSRSTSSAPEGASAPRRKVGWKLEAVRFTFSDVKLWNELDRILKLDTSQAALHNHPHTHTHPLLSPTKSSSSSSASSSAPGLNNSVNGGWGTWAADMLVLYEDMCIICATLYVGLGAWRANSRASFSSASGSDGILGLGSPTSHSFPRFSSMGKRKDKNAATSAWGTARAPGDTDFSLEGFEIVQSEEARGADHVENGGPRIRTLGLGIEGSPRKEKDKEGARIRQRGRGIEGRSHHDRGGNGSGNWGGIVNTQPQPRRRIMARTAPGSCKASESGNTNKALAEDDVGDDDAQQQQEEEFAADEEMLQKFYRDHNGESLESWRRRQTVQTTLALLQTFHAHTVFLLSTLRDILGISALPPSIAPLSLSVDTAAADSRVPSNVSEDTSGGDYAADLEEGDASEDVADTITITARDMLALELGLLSDLDARFVEWLVEAEGYIAPSFSATSDAIETQQRQCPRRVVVKHGWGEFLGIVFGLK